jgi:hypothetical protein
MEVRRFVLLEAGTLPRAFSQFGGRKIFTISPY